MTWKLSFTRFGYTYTRFCSVTKSKKYSFLSNPLKFCVALMFFFSCGITKLHGKSNPIRAKDSSDTIAKSQYMENNNNVNITVVAPVAPPSTVTPVAVPVEKSVSEKIISFVLWCWKTIVAIISAIISSIVLALKYGVRFVRFITTINIKKLQRLFSILSPKYKRYLRIRVYKTYKIILSIIL